MCFCRGVYMHMGVSDLLELELQVVINCPVWVLRIELRSSGKAIHYVFFSTEPPLQPPATDVCGELSHLLWQGVIAVREAVVKHNGSQNSFRADGWTQVVFKITFWRKPCNCRERKSREKQREWQLPTCKIGAMNTCWSKLGDQSVPVLWKFQVEEKLGERCYAMVS